MPEREPTLIIMTDRDGQKPATPAHPDSGFQIYEDAESNVRPWDGWQHGSGRLLAFTGFCPLVIRLL